MGSEIISVIDRRWRWPAEEKLKMSFTHRRTNSIEISAGEGLHREGQRVDRRCSAKGRRRALDGAGSWSRSLLACPSIWR